MREFLKRCAIAAGLMYFALAAYGAYRLHHRPLPHRAFNELTNWGQGKAHGAGDCPPGTIEFEVYDMFLECYRTGR
jgi:hypothetical protein